MHTDKNKNEKTVGYLANIVSFVYPEPMLKHDSMYLSIYFSVYFCLHSYFLFLLYFFSLFPLESKKSLHTPLTCQEK